MNYEEMSDQIVEAAVENQAFKETGIIKSFDLNNPGDWGKLMDDNKISTTWWPDEEGGNESCWEAATGKRWENSRHKTSPGRAISICYLKSKGVNNG